VHLEGTRSVNKRVINTAVKRLYQCDNALGFLLHIFLKFLHKGLDIDLNLTGKPANAEINCLQNWLNTKLHTGIQILTPEFSSDILTLYLA